MIKGVTEIKYTNTIEAIVEDIRHIKDNTIIDFKFPDYASHTYGSLALKELDINPETLIGEKIIVDCGKDSIGERCIRAFYDNKTIANAYPGLMYKRHKIHKF